MTDSKITGRSCTKSKFIVILLIILVFGLGIFCIWRMSGANWSFGDNPKSTKTTTKIQDKNFVGVWESSCLVTNTENSSWEKYRFEIKDDNTAIYTRQISTNKDCIEVKTETVNYRYSLLKNGQINLRDNVNKKTIYDIYSIKENKLKFGHGYRGSYPESTKKGDTSGGRYDSFNEYIVYEKK